METRKIAFFFIETTTIHQPTLTQAYTTKSMDVRYQYFTDSALKHLQSYGRYSYGDRSGSHIIKLPNIAILDLPYEPPHWARLNNLCQSIATGIQHSYHPFKPISHITLEDHPEWML